MLFFYEIGNYIRSCILWSKGNDGLLKDLFGKYKR